MKQGFSNRQIMTQGTKLSPQQLQFIKLLHLTTQDLEARVKEEIIENPVIEDVKEENKETNQDEGKDNFEADDAWDEGKDSRSDFSLDDYSNNDDYGYKMQGDGPGSSEDEKESPRRAEETLTEGLLTQLGYLKLPPKQELIGRQLIGNIDSDGYMRRELDAIVNEMAFQYSVETDLKEVESVLFKVQMFDPQGIAARSLQECLEIQIKRKNPKENPTALLALKTVSLCFEEFTKKHYPKIQRKLGATEAELKAAVDLIVKLNPKPGEPNTLVKDQAVIPDFIVEESDGKLKVSLNSKNAPELRISRYYSDMLRSYGKSKDKKAKEAVAFIKQKIDSANWFIEAIEKRQETLMSTMEAIVGYQSDFFLSGDEAKLRPLILKDIAEQIGMDISTVSRVTSTKYVQTDMGVYPLKFFFSEGLITESGEEVSSKVVKSLLRDLIEREDKRKPLSDEKLEKLLHVKGYNIARRTVAKYREQLDIPVARLRKEMSGAKKVKEKGQVQAAGG